MKEYSEISKLASEVYKSIERHDAELAQLEGLIDGLESQISRLGDRTPEGLRQALSEARVLANDHRTQRNKSIDVYNMIMDSNPGLSDHMFNQLCDKLIQEKKSEKGGNDAGTR